MAYPDKINALVDVTADQTLAAGGHAARHNDVNDALDELKAVFTAPAADTLGFAPDGSTERVRIESSGRVVLSDSLLSSGQLIRSGDDSITNQASLLFYRSGAGSTTGTRASFVTKGDASGNVDKLSVEIGGSRRVGFFENGAVLIGTETPGSASAGDLVVNGGVFLGGSAAANELDDYEEGTFTPTYEPGTGAFGTITYDSVTGGKYIKIGNVVHYWLRLRTDAITIGTASGDLFVGGLPFTVPSGSQAQFAASGAAEVSTWAGDAPLAALAITGTTRLRLNYRSSANGDSLLCNPADLGTGANANALLVAGTYWLA